MTGWAGVDWSLAPTWATHWAMDGDGKACWFGLDFDWSDEFDGWLESPKFVTAPTFNYTGAARDSLTVRPAQKDATP